MEYTLENKIKFITQYWGQEVLTINGLTGKHIINTKTVKKITDDDFLSLKSLDNITLEDAETIIEDGKDCMTDFTEYGVFRPNQGSEQYTSESVDYLRSKGYAIGFMGLSVKHLISYGWIVII